MRISKIILFPYTKNVKINSADGNTDIEFDYVIPGYLIEVKSASDENAMKNITQTMKQMQKYIDFLIFAGDTNYKCYLYYGNVKDMTSITNVVNDEYPNGNVIAINDLNQLNFTYEKTYYLASHMSVLYTIFQYDMRKTNIITYTHILLRYISVCTNEELNKFQNINFYLYDKYKNKRDNNKNYLILLQQTYNLNIIFIEKADIAHDNIKYFNGFDAYKAKAKGEIDSRKKYKFDIKKTMTGITKPKKLRLLLVFQYKLPSVITFPKREMRNDIKDILKIDDLSIF